MTEIVRSEAVLGGDPRLEGRRISVLQISEMVLDGDQSPEYVADQLDISLGDVHSALAYYYDNPTEMESIRARHKTLEKSLAERSVEPGDVDR